MPRAPRLSYPGAIHHATSRGVGRGAIFQSEADYQVFLATLNDAGREVGWVCLAYCLMPNHYHLLIITPDAASLSKGMQDLNGVYAARYNTAHDRSGHVFQGRFHDELVRRNVHLLEALRYIVLNPVRAGLVNHPGSWPWSSYGSTLGTRRQLGILDARSVLAQFGNADAEAKRRYADFVADGFSAARRPPLGIVIDASTGRGVARACDDLGYTQREIAAHLGVSQPTVSRMIRRDRHRE